MGRIVSLVSLKPFLPVHTKDATCIRFSATVRLGGEVSYCPQPFPLIVWYCPFIQGIVVVCPVGLGAGTAGCR